MNRRQVILLASGLSVHAASAAAPRNFVMSDAPKQVPALQFTDATGSLRTLANFSGKTVLLNLWATWCVPCRTEMPALDRLQAAIGSADFEVVPVSIDRKGMDAVNKFYSEAGLTHLARYVDPTNQLSQSLGIFGIPTTLLIGRQGYELGRLIGPAEWDSLDIVAFLENVIVTQKEISP